MHTSDEVCAWIKETNLTERPMIIYEFIEAGMTSICQPADVVIMKPLKDNIKKNMESIGMKLQRILFLVEGF